MRVIVNNRLARFLTRLINFRLQLKLYGNMTFAIVLIGKQVPIMLVFLNQEVKFSNGVKIVNGGKIGQ